MSDRILKVGMVGLTMLAAQGCVTTDRLPDGLATSRTFIVGGERRLETEPCGCALNPRGGLAREGKVLSSFGSSRIAITGGLNFLREDGTSTGKERTALAERVQAVGYDAYVPSSRESSLGKAELARLKVVSRLPWVSSNLVDASGKPLFETSRTFSVDNGLPPVILLGLTSVIRVPNGIGVLPPGEAAVSVLSKLSPPRDALVVVAGDLSIDEWASVLDRVPRIQVALALDPTGSLKEVRSEQRGPDQVMVEVPGHFQLARLSVPWGTGESFYSAELEYGMEIRRQSLEMELARLTLWAGKDPARIHRLERLLAADRWRYQPGRKRSPNVEVEIYSLDFRWDERPVPTP